MIPGWTPITILTTKKSAIHAKLTHLTSSFHLSVRFLGLTLLQTFRSWKRNMFFMLNLRWTIDEQTVPLIWYANIVISNYYFDVFWLSQVVQDFFHQQKNHMGSFSWNDWRFLPVTLPKSKNFSPFSERLVFEKVTTSGWVENLNIIEWGATGLHSGK